MNYKLHSVDITFFYKMLSHLVCWLTRINQKLLSTYKVYNKYNMNHINKIDHIY